MRYLAEIIMDRNADTPDADEMLVAEQLDEEYMPAPGTIVYVSGDEGESAYTVTAVRVWREEMTRGNGRRVAQSEEMSMATEQH